MRAAGAKQRHESRAQHQHHNNIIMQCRLSEIRDTKYMEFVGKFAKQAMIFGGCVESSKILVPPNENVRMWKIRVPVAWIWRGQALLSFHVDILSLPRVHALELDG